MPISLLDRWTARARKECVYVSAIGTLRGGYITLHPACAKGYFKGRRVNWASKFSSVYTSDAILLDYLHTGFAKSFFLSRTELLQANCSEDPLAFLRSGCLSPALPRY